MRILQTIGALLLGLFSGMVVIMSIQSIGAILYPVPPGFDLHHNPDQFREFVKTLPISAFLIVLAAWALGTFCSAWVAVRLAPGRPLWPAWVLGGFFLLVAVIILTHHPSHPLWMMVIGVLEFLPSAWLGGRTARRGIDRAVAAA